MALGPSLVLAEEAGSRVLSTSLSRRLHCLLHRRSRPLTQYVVGRQRISVVSALRRTVIANAEPEPGTWNLELPGRHRPEAPVPQTKSAARQNTSPASVVHCHGARTKSGPRGGGRLSCFVDFAVAPPPLFASPALPAADAHR